MKKKKILLLMSGGVDSSVAGYLLKKDWDVIGATMKTGAAETDSAERVAHALGIPHYVLETEEIFARAVVRKAIECRKLGLTPNPCADCNAALKFGAIPEIMREKLGFDFDIATGHYARIVRNENKSYLARAAYPEKDQSYFLCDIPREILPKLHFPLGEMTKRAVREQAREAGLEVSEKPESMDACFELPKHNAAGDIVNMEGKIVGKHTGVFNYTIGQRKGLGIAHSEPLFVIKIDEIKNQLIVGTREQSFTREVQAEKPNILAPDLLSDFENKSGIFRHPERTGSPRNDDVSWTTVGVVPVAENGAFDFKIRQFFAKTRSRGEPESCKIIHLDEKKLCVLFDEPTFAPTPGQRLVCYNSDGIIVVSGTILQVCADAPIARRRTEPL